MLGVNWQLAITRSIEPILRLARTLPLFTIITLIGRPILCILVEFLQHFVKAIIFSLVELISVLLRPILGLKTAPGLANDLARQLGYLFRWLQACVWAFEGVV